MNSKTVKPVFIVGPTAVGKSEAGFNLAKKLGGVVVSADSMQIYRGLDIGTAKESRLRRAEVKHEMIDIIPYQKDFSVAEYAKSARKIIDDYVRKDVVPVIVGGTGLYVESLLFPMNFAGTAKNEELRTNLIAESETLGAAHMHAKLRALDPESAEKLHENDTKRIIRALEIVITTGKTRKENDDGPSEPIDAVVVGLTADRKILYDNINARVDKMFENGLIEEIASLDGNFEYQSMKAIGYREFSGHKVMFKSDKAYLPQSELTEIKDKIKQDTRNYAKRQITWFKKYPFVKWFDMAETAAAENYIIDALHKQC